LLVGRHVRRSKVDAIMVASRASSFSRERRAEGPLVGATIDRHDDPVDLRGAGDREEQRCGLGDVAQACLGAGAGLDGPDDRV